MKSFLIGFLLIFGIWFFFIKEDVVQYGAGVMAPSTPVQTKIKSARTIVKDEYIIMPQANFNIHAKVLSRKNYSIGRESDLSPVDFALGWGRMSDEAVLSSIDISQSGRWYHWQSSNFPIPRREIETHSANMHIIPANDLVKEMIDEVKQGDIITIKGSLVYVNASDGWHWRSSLSRNDTGNGACEIILVDTLRIDSF